MTLERVLFNFQKQLSSWLFSFPTHPLQSLTTPRMQCGKWENDERMELQNDSHLTGSCSPNLTGDEIGLFLSREACMASPRAPCCPLDSGSLDYHSSQPASSQLHSDLLLAHCPTRHFYRKESDCTRWKSPLMTHAQGTGKNIFVLFPQIPGSLIEDVLSRFKVRITYHQYSLLTCLKLLKQLQFFGEKKITQTDSQSPFLKLFTPLQGLTPSKIIKALWQEHQPEFGDNFPVFVNHFGNTRCKIICLLHQKPSEQKSLEIFY